MEEDNGIKLRCIPLDVLGGHETLKKIINTSQMALRTTESVCGGVGWGGIIDLLFK